MARTVNGKVLTDNSLMDEIVYQTKIILKNIILKNETTANENETEESITESDYFIACKNGSMEISFFPFTVQWLLDYGYDIYEATVYASDWRQIPEEDRDALMEYSINRYINEYEEKNNYYRMLSGLPAYNTTEYDIYIDPTDPRLDEDDGNTDFNFGLPIHKFTLKQISTLKSLGIIDDLIAEHNGDHNYKYLSFLGGSKVDVYIARIAANWDILSMPTCENLVKNRFKELYAINRDIYMNRTFQAAYSFMSDYFDEMVMVMILSETFANMIAEVPEWYIRRDIFDLRSAQYFLESQGVRFFKEIPLKYQIRLVKNLNRLIKYKSTNRNIHDILEIFGMENTTVYKYYLYKDYLPSWAGKYDGIDEYGNKFMLSFIQVPLDESYDRYIQDNMYIKDYDTVTEVDKYWDGDLYHDFVKKKHGEKDFSIEGTKYLFLDYNVDMLKYRFQMSYFLGMLFNSSVYTEDINLMVPEISENNYYSVLDLCILLCCLAGPYNNTVTRIHTPMIKEEEEWVMKDLYDFGDEEYDIIYYDPTVYDGEKLDFGVNYTPDPTKPYHRYDFGEDEEGVTYVHPTITDPVSVDDESVQSYINDHNTNEDWLTRDYEYLWLYNKWKIYGFNLTVDLEKLEQDISFNHSAFGFEKSYTLSDFGCDTFMTADKIDNIDDFVSIYRNNKKCYDNLMHFFEYDCMTRDQAVVAQYVYDNLFLTKFDLDFYRLKSGEIAEYYIDILKERSMPLYKFYMELTKEPDLEAQKDGIRIILNNIVTTLEYFIDSKNDLEYIFAFVPTSSSEAIVRYLYLVIDFFKSWKVHFLDPASSYTLADKYDDKNHFYEDLAELRYKYWKDDQNSTRDSYKTTVKLHFIDPLYTHTKETLEIYGYFDIDLGFDNCYNGWYPDTIGEEIIDVDGGGVVDCVPFVMVNGGTPFGIGLYDTITLDGGYSADSPFFIDVDGHDIGDPNWTPLISNDLKPVGYSVFGGYPGKHWSDSLYTNIDGTLQISNDLKVSIYPINNGLESEPDGLYFGNGIGDYVSGTTYREFLVVMDYIDGELIPSGYIYAQNMRLFTSSAYMDNMVRREYAKILKPAIEVQNPSESIFDEELFNTLINRFSNWFNETWPYGWRSF